MFRHSCIYGAVLAVFFSATSVLASGPSSYSSLDVLGAALFHDMNLSKNRTQSCASCHQAARAFTDGNGNGVESAVSLGDDGISLGDRNTPTLSYAFLTPDFHRDSSGLYTGGFFLDGRAATLAMQASLPMVNPIEMALADAEEVAERVLENPLYGLTLQKFYGEKIIEDPEKVYLAVSESIALFESSSEFAPFDSRYDRYLRGEYEMSKTEELGRKIFFSDLISCNGCHLVNLSPHYKKETFTNYQYHNIGVPVNSKVRAINGSDPAYVDRGLLENPAINSHQQSGKFKVPSLRNVAVTGPYMHNGVFSELKTVIQFYNKYLVDNVESRRNPETGEAWPDAEVAENISLELLTKGQPLDSNFVNALEAFLGTLTDQRYEDLLQ